MKSNVYIQKKNEVYLTVECEPHVGYELADKFTFEVPQAKFMSAYKKRFWDGKIKLFSPGTGEIYVGLLPYITAFCEEKGYEVIHRDNEFYGLPQEVDDQIVKLLANSAEALEDFAVIQTEQDIANFNKKYGVNLVLPAEA